jgi:hypothetical protein
MHKNFSYDLITWNLFPQRKNMNYEKHVTREEVSTSTNLNIWNIVFHGKTTIAEIEWQFYFFKYFSISLYYWLITWLSFLLSNKLSNVVVHLTLQMYHRIERNILFGNIHYPEIYLVWITNNGLLCVDVLNALLSWNTFCF